MSKIILTTMVKIIKDNGDFLVQIRTKNDWPGLTFPGGHVEDNEDIEQCAIREIKEETGLTISNLISDYMSKGVEFVFGGIGKLIET